MTATPWGFTVPGQPLSWNEAYRIGVRYRPGSRGGQYRTIIKTDEAVAYTDAVTMIAKTAKPSHWPNYDRLIVVELRLYLGRSVDADNTMKMIMDGLKAALGVDDKWFLPRAMWTEWGLRPDQRRVEVQVSDFELS